MANISCWWMKTLLLSVLLIQCSTYHFYRSTVYKNCGSRFRIFSVEESGCKKPYGDCLLEPRKSGAIRITFSPDRYVRSVRTIFTADVGGITYPFDLGSGCRSYNLTCPLLPGRKYYYVRSKRVDQMYPTGIANIQWMVMEDKKFTSRELPHPDICIKFRTRIL